MHIMQRKSYDMIHKLLVQTAEEEENNLNKAYKISDINTL